MTSPRLNARHGVLNRAVLGIGLAMALATTVASESAVAQPLPTQTATGLLVLSITPGAGTFIAGQPVRLSFEVRNASAAACQMPGLADGSLVITAVERDGAPVFPVLGSRYYSDGPGQAIRDSLEPLDPGAAREFQLAHQAGDRMFLRSSSFASSGRSGLALWPVDQPGAYRLTAAYGTPGNLGACSGSAIATVDFRVVAPTDGVLLALVGLVGAALVGIAVVAVLLRRRRAPATALILLLSVSSSLVAPPSVLGVIEVAPGDAALSTLVGGCMGQFRAPGGDPAGVFRALETSSQKVRIEPIAIGKPSTDSTDPANSRQGKSTGSLIYVNPDYTGVFADGVAFDQCSALYHEMSHALDFANGTDDGSACGNTGIAVAEVKAVLIENQWRRAHNLTPRTRYGGKTIPPSVDDCRRKKPSGPRRSGGRGIDCDAGACGSSNGDPHLGTFDGRYYDLQAAGEFVLAHSHDGDFQAQARQVPFPGSNHVSVNSALAFGVEGHRVAFYAGVGESAGGPVTVVVDGSTVEVSDAIPLASGGILEPDSESPGAYFIEWPDGSLAWVGPVGAWGIQTVIQPAPVHRGALAGVLGNFDADTNREFFTREGDLVANMPSFEQLHGEFADSWRLREGESLFDYAPGETTESFTLRDFPRAEIALEDIPDAELLRAACLAEGVTGEEFLRQCIIDLALTGLWELALGAGNVDAALGGNGQLPSGPVVPIATGQSGPLPQTGAQARVINLYTENGQPVEIDVYAYTWSETEVDEVASLVATVSYGKASDWFNPGLVVPNPFDETPQTRVRIFRHGETNELDALVGVGEFLGDAGTQATIVVWQEEVFEGEPDAWVEVMYAEHPTYPVPSAPAGGGLILGRHHGLAAEGGTQPSLYASVGDGCLEHPLSDPSFPFPQPQPIGNELMIPTGEHTLTVHADAASGEPATCETEPLGPGVPITVAPGDRFLVFPYQLPGATEINTLVVPFDAQ